MTTEPELPLIPRRVNDMKRQAEVLELNGDHRDFFQQEPVKVLTRKERKYLPTLSDLVDRLSIVLLKSIFIEGHREEYIAERRLIEHDIDVILSGLIERVTAADIHAICVIMLANRIIWQNESKVRNGESQDLELLRLTHSINGIRNAAKNELARLDGGRKDFKIDCLAADLPRGFGDWRVFSD